MSYCKQEETVQKGIEPDGSAGKDKIIFVTKEDHEAPSNAELVADDPNDPYDEHGLILPNGDINWNCPCLGGMASGPCGQQFKDAFSCFHYSTEEIKGSECVDYFRGMQECMQRYPELYPQEDDEPPPSQTPVPTADDPAPAGNVSTPAAEDSALATNHDSDSTVPQETPTLPSEDDSTSPASSSSPTS